VAQVRTAAVGDRECPGAAGDEPGRDISGAVCAPLRAAHVGAWRGGAVSRATALGALCQPATACRVPHLHSSSGGGSNTAAAGVAEAVVLYIKLVALLDHMASCSISFEHWELEQHAAARRQCWTQARALLCVR
jgi:hypothetical protein